MRSPSDADPYTSRVRLDLHCHSTRSDGSLEPGEVARLAGEFGVELFCLTDHDTMAGYATTRERLAEAVVLRGLELSCKHFGRTVHLLVLGVAEDEAGEALQRRLDRVNADRGKRLRGIVDRLAKLGIALDADQVLDGTKGGTPGRPHVARAMVKACAVKTVREAFDRYLHDGGPADVEIDRISLEEGLALGRAAGAKMSLAHPHTLRDFGVVEEMFRMFRGEGLEGIEAWYGGYGPSKREPWLRLATQQALIVTAGSDFHGDIVPEVSRPGIELPEPHATRLREWLGLPVGST